MASGFTGGMKSLVTTSVIVGIVLFGIIITFLVSWVLSKTALKGVPTHYTLELPPYRKPKFVDTVIRSSLTKSLSVLNRAIKVAAPAAILTWIISEYIFRGYKYFLHMVNFLDHFDSVGLDGFMLMAFLIGYLQMKLYFPFF